MILLWPEKLSPKTSSSLSGSNWGSWVSSMILYVFYKPNPTSGKWLQSRPIGLYFPLREQGFALLKKFSD